MNNTNTIVGTIQQFEAMGLSLNGVVLDQPSLSLLTRIGRGTFAKEVKKISTGKRGKPSTVWELSLQFDVTLATVNPAVPAIVASDAAEATAEPETEATTETVSEPVADTVETVEAAAEEVMTDDTPL